MGAVTNQRTLRAALLRKIDEILLFRTRKERDRAAHRQIPENAGGGAASNVYFAHVFRRDASPN